MRDYQKSKVYSAETWMWFEHFDVKWVGGGVTVLTPDEVELVYTKLAGLFGVRVPRVEYTTSGSGWYYSTGGGTIKLSRDQRPAVAVVTHEFAHHVAASTGKGDRHGARFVNAHVMIVKALLGEEVGDKLLASYAVRGCFVDAASQQEYLQKRKVAVDRNRTRAGREGTGYAVLLDSGLHADHQYYEWLDHSGWDSTSWASKHTGKTTVPWEAMVWRNRATAEKHVAKHSRRYPNARVVEVDAVYSVRWRAKQEDVLVPEAETGE